ncbi:MAG: hypothetical protein NVSMB1_21230 [Polyangiales bacterium]
MVGLRAAIVCPSRLNEARASGRHMFIVDLHSMERVALALHADHAESARADDDLRAPLEAVCGKVGGMDYYSNYFGPLSNRLWSIERETSLASAYRFPGLGRITFLKDGDDTDPLVGLASLVGKYLRELMMGRVVRFMRTLHARAEASQAMAIPLSTPSGAPNSDVNPRIGLPNASGYRDPITKNFIAATALLRQKNGVPDRCFRRGDVWPNPSG